MTDVIRVKAVGNWTFYSESGRDEFINRIYKTPALVRVTEIFGPGGRSAWVVFVFEAA